MTVYEPAVLTWPNGQKVTLTRSGDIVTADIEVAGIATMDASGMPWPADYFKPRGDATMYLQPVNTYMLVLADSALGADQIGLFANGTAAPWANGSVQWLAEPETVPTWATIDDVDDITGLTVTNRDIMRAVHTLETITGLIQALDRPDITDRDRYFLKLMTCYQVAFMDENPDLFSRNDVTSASQDGESAAYRNVDSHLFGPLARKAYRRLSWRAKRFLVIEGTIAPHNRIDVNSEAFDDHLPWTPM